MNILIIPGCDDSNRGDQALIWESVRVLQDAGIDGQYYMISTKESSEQSQKENIISTPYILPHPSVYFKNLNDNRKYTLKIKALWGIRSIRDLCVAAPLTKRGLRRIAKLFLTNEKRSTYELYQHIDFAVVKGGGFLHSESGLLETYKIYFFLYHIRLAISMGIPVLVMPNSFGSFGSKIARKLIHNTLSRCKLITSRESISNQILWKECGIRTKTTMDLGAYLQKDSQFNALEYLKANNININGGKNVVITVRPYRFPGKKNPDKLYMKYISALATLTVWLCNNEYFPVFVEHVYSDNYHESDIKAIDDIIKLLNGKSVRYGIISDHTLNCRQIKSIYSCFDYMVGTRFHSVIFALFSHVPSIAITYGGNKGTGIMRDLGISEYSIEIEKIDDELLISTFQNMLDNHDEYLKLLDKNKIAIIDQRKELISWLQKGIREK